MHQNGTGTSITGLVDNKIILFFSRMVLKKIMSSNLLFLFSVVTLELYSYTS